MMCSEVIVPRTRQDQKAGLLEKLASLALVDWECHHLFAIGYAQWRLQVTMLPKTEQRSVRDITWPLLPSRA